MNQDFLSQIERQLMELVPASPESLYGPVRGILRAGGKRARLVLTLLAAKAEGRIGEIETRNAAIAGTAVELLHTFTLVHDDIMDNASTRRGKPTLHMSYGLSAAILSGDVLVALAADALSKIESPLQPRMLAEFALGFRSVCEGQALDKEFESRPSITVDDYIGMIDLKTAKIFELAAVLGSLAAGGAHVEAVRAFAHHLGLAFQVNDDLLDLIGDEKTFGKTPGGDILEGKRTFLFAIACERYSSLDAATQPLIDRIRSRVTTQDDVVLARDAMQRAGILDFARVRSADETERAEQAIAALPGADELRAFGRALLARDR